MSGDLNLKEQLAFYFSDANLRRDKFLIRLTGPRGTNEVPVATFMTFNKIAAITKDQAVAVAALREVEDLRVTDDGKCVARLRPLKTGDECDERTVYVENLPAGSTRESVQRRFTQCGPVAYTSTPRLNAGAGTGFVFIEFGTAEGARRAVADLDGAAVEAEGSAADGADGSSGGPRLRVMTQKTWATMKAEYKTALKEGKQEAEAEAAGHAAAERAEAADAADAKRCNVVQVRAIPKKGGAIKELRKEMREVFGAVAPVEYVDYGISNSGDTTVAFVRMCTTVGAAEAVRLLTDRKTGFGAEPKAPVDFSLLRGERLTSYLKTSGGLRRATAASRKGKRDKWWARKYGDKGESGEGGEEEEEAEAAATSAAGGGKRAREEAEAGDAGAGASKLARADVDDAE